MRRIFLGLLLAVSALGCWPACGQRVGVKTNVLSDAFSNVNIGVEVGLAPRWTFEILGDYNGWTMSGGRKWKHWLAEPAVRYWFCDRFAGHFIGMHALGGQYNIGGLKNGVSFLGTDFSLLSTRRYQGWCAGAGVLYGYAWILGKHWNLEAELGVGWVYTRYDAYPCSSCGMRLEHDRPHHYIGPTRAGINLVYVF
jgi:hypothetical protein